ncbi:hybrid sensor histidine kinase/response regulator [Dyella monticola]|uniref:histidine kinase n=1 Tax=Dyella monticola TaxID=1927958 RepID=A0A370WYW8_9GAMM|nr:response regulator [Dyella monticola]RDS81165.1 hybrid sensor histidine kinase/response regulator [Dyella monticola]
MTAKLLDQGHVTFDAQAQPAASRARVLIVDDDEHNLHAIRTVLEDVAEVVQASSGEEALRHLLKGEFAVILLDVYMPGMDGYETAQMIRAREHTKRIPIIFLSAVNKEVEHLIRGYSMGAVDYVFKPVEPIVLQSKVAVFVDLYLMRREIQLKARHEQKLLDANLRANADRLRAEQELRLAEQRQSAIIASLPIVLYLEEHDAAPHVPKFVSGNFHALTGFTFEELAADPTQWMERLHPDDHARVTAALAARKGGRSYSVEYRWQTADGQYRHFLDQAVLLPDAHGQPLEYAGTLLDVTDRKELESQLLHARKMDALGQITGGIAHDFNNLLAAILGGLELLELRVQMEPAHRRLFATTRRAAEHGAALVTRLLAFARKQKLQPASIDMTALSTAVTQLLEHTMGGMVMLEWQLDEGLWHPYADEGQLELALMNLAINARDAMPEGGTIQVSCRNACGDDAGLADGDYVVLAVSDTGCGIAPEDLERVTEPFFTTKAVDKGTGLGLSMVYGFARQSGGTVRIESRLGQGTTVEIWLPRAMALPQPATGAAVDRTSIQDGRPNRGQQHVLLVDDHDGVRMTTVTLLEELGYRVTAVPDGAQAVDLPNEELEDIDLLISDYAMPLMSGSEIIRKLRTKRNALPAIIITGHADAISNLPESVLVLPKPFTLAQLQDAITVVESRHAATVS